MGESILTVIKQMLGLEVEYDVYDTDVKVLINGALNTLTQLGVGPSNGFAITGYSETWGDLLGGKIERLIMAQEYVYLKVKTVFDPPTSSAVMQAYLDKIREDEWRLNVNAENEA